MTEDDIKLYNSLFNRIKEAMNWTDQKTDQWFHASNPNFGGCSALDLLNLGRGHKLERFIEGQLKGNFE